MVECSASAYIIKGEHFDGNDYVEQAQKAGASYIIQGPNALSELQEMAQSWRILLGLPVVAYFSFL